MNSKNKKFLIGFILCLVITFISSWLILLFRYDISIFNMSNTDKLIARNQLIYILSIVGLIIFPVFFWFINSKNNSGYASGIIVAVFFIMGILFLFNLV